jgi:hypothetical protein
VFQAEPHTTACSYKLTLNGFNAAPTSYVPTCGYSAAVSVNDGDVAPGSSHTWLDGLVSR